MESWVGQIIYPAFQQIQPDYRFDDSVVIMEILWQERGMKHLSLLLSVAILCACAPSANTSAATETTPAVESSALEPPAAKTALILPRSVEYTPDGATLIFSATTDWRHDSGIAGASAFWAREADENGSGLYTTEDARVFTPEFLKKFGVIVMNSATGDVLSKDQQDAIQGFVENGGGLIAQHAMGDSSLAGFWPWWETQLGTEFISHPADPQFQTADVVSLAPSHPVMAGLGAKFSHSDEWYTFTGPVSGDVVVLAGLDESTYSPVNKVYGVEDLRMGPEPSDHPIVWAKCPGKGKIVYSALGHKADAYDSEPHTTLLKNAMKWVRSEGDTGCP